MDHRKRAAKNINAGPVDPSILYLQPVHVSEAVWQGHNDRVLRPRRHVSLNLRYPPLQLVPWLQLAGFYGAARAGYFPYDHHLISAMVERWRPETHTFHMPMGECTITLQDVAIQLGLPVDGLPVVGVTRLDWPDLCEHAFGLRPPPEAIKGQRLRLNWLDENFGDDQLPEDPTPVQLVRFTRAYIMRLIGGFLMPDTSGNWVQLIYLPLLADLDLARRYSWGSAVLAYLFREMCEATRYDAQNIGGCMHLLHVWVWDRFPSLAPRLTRRHPERLSEVEENQMYPTPPPLSYRWTDYRGLKDASMHLVAIYRKTIDQMFDHNVVWEPYDPRVCFFPIPQYCQEAADIWRAEVPLICFHIVEWHQPDRVLRQFGLQQPVPNPPVDLDILHTIKLTGRAEVNWSVEHRIYTDLWEQRRNRIVTTAVAFAPLSQQSQYMRWYREITRKWIDPEGATMCIAADGFHYVRQCMDDVATNEKAIRDLCDQMTSSIFVHRRSLPNAGDHNAAPLPELPHPPADYVGPSRARSHRMSRTHPVVTRLLDDDGDGDDDDDGDDDGGDDDGGDDDGGDDVIRQSPHFPWSSSFATPPPYQMGQFTSPSEASSSRRPRESPEQPLEDQPQEQRRRGQRERRPRMCGTGSHLLGDT